MKYIFLSKTNNRELKDAIISHAGAEIVLNLFTGGNSDGEMWITYDDVTNRMSFFNSISKQRKSEYRVIEIGDSRLSTFILIWAKIKGYVDMDIEGRNITHVSTSRKFGKFDDLFIDNNFDNIVKLRTANTVLLVDSPSEDSKNDKSNIGIISIDAQAVSIREGVGVDLLTLRQINLVSYELSKASEIFGCNLEEFIRGMGDINVNTEVKALSNKYCSKRLMAMYGKDLSGSIVPVINEDRKVRFVSIKHKGEVVTVRMEDFLSSIDLSLNVFKSMAGEKSIFKPGKRATINSNSIFGTTGHMFNQNKIIDIEVEGINLWDGSRL